MRYLNLLKNQFLISRAWMLTSLLLAIITIFLSFALIKMANNLPVRVVTLDYLSSHGYVEVDSLNKANNSEYLISIAAADIVNFTTWHNANVIKQYARFINRFSPSLFNKISAQLRDTASIKSKTQEAQTFFIDKTSINSKLDTVKITGVLRMYQGIELTKSIKMSYTLNYNTRNQLPMLNSFQSEVLDD